MGQSPALLNCGVGYSYGSPVILLRDARFEELLSFEITRAQLVFFMSTP